MRRAIREHMRDFVAIGALLVLAVLTTGVILVEQRFKLPGWIPGLGSDRFELKAEISSAQAVTPGQGQTVNLSGIKVGDLTAVEVVDGRAVVSMEIDNEFAALIHEDASFLLRPRTGLQDMTLELDPGTEESPAVAEGATIPATQTLTNVQFDQVLGSLDGDTQAFLRLLVVNGGEALGDGRGRKLGSALRKLEPFSRELAKLNGALAKRRQNIAGAVTSFGEVSEELAADDTRLADFIDSSNQVLDSFANQEANLRATFQELPGALSQTRAALESGDRLARVLGPSSRALIPSAQALGPALRQSRPFFRDTVDPIREQIRPFTRQVADPVRHIRQGAAPLGQTTRNLAGGITEINRLFNAIAYNPPGPEEGYSFWLAWLNHNTNNLFLNQDSGGPLRRGLVLQSCQTAQLAEGLAAERPFLRTLQQVTNVPASTTICPLD